MKLRVVAVSAPDWIAGKKDATALNSTDPASLFNACRHAAMLARDGIGAWGGSNWAVPRAELRSRFLLMYSLDDMDRFRELMERERPNLLLLGAMTLSFPGAIECARVAREVCGDDLFIVLGGRHVSESIWLDAGSQRLSAFVNHHKASPVILMKYGVVPRVFDLVLAGDGEEVISTIGEAIAFSEPHAVRKTVVEKLRQPVPGDWIAISCDDSEEIVVSKGIPINYNEMPSIAKIFGVSASFDVFGGRMTAHIFSDTGSGCVYDCSFCSERTSITGGLRDISQAPKRLYRQMADAARVIREDWPDRGASAFVEDSVFLGGAPRLIDLFCEKLETQPIDIVFGAQFTIDQILRRRAQIQRLAANGLRYVFVGLETFQPEEIGGMSKDIGFHAVSWQHRFDDVLGILADSGIACGCALLFGLGEPHASRLALLDALAERQRTMGAPIAVSANWAVQHPLKNTAGTEPYDYVDWGTPPGPFLDLFHRFGEASLLYPIREVEPVSLNELTEVVDRLDAFPRTAELVS